MNIVQEFETITAIATPLGTGGVGVIRISGEKSFEIISKLFSPLPLTEGTIAHGWIKDNGIKIDEVIILPFKSPKSYTGEDVIEIQCHGGINVIRNILELVLKNGARLAEKGEFTKRAFLNHKLDLSQAEAVADLIHSKTQNFAKKTAKNLSGVLTQKTAEIKNKIFNLLSQIVAGIDFPEDVKEPEYDFIIKEIENAINEIDNILACAKSSNILRQGIKITITGKPNVGKSSLFNTLLSLDRAIVTDIAGTTRDILKETIDFEGIPITLIDTAGIREDKNINKVEKIGIEYSKEALEEADLILFLHEINDNEFLEQLNNKNYLKLATKVDLTDKRVENEINISCKTQEGINELKEKIKNFLHFESTKEPEYITNNRQQDCLRKAKIHLETALNGAKNKELQDMLSIDIKSSILSLEEITGELITEDILNNIFENFCIGK